MMRFLRCVSIKIAVFHVYKNIHLTQLISAAVSLPMKISIASQIEKTLEAAEN